MRLPGDQKKFEKKIRIFLQFFSQAGTVEENTWHFEVLLLFLSLRYGANLGRTRLVRFWDELSVAQPFPSWYTKPNESKYTVCGIYTYITKWEGDLKLSPETFGEFGIIGQNIPQIQVCNFVQITVGERPYHVSGFGERERPRPKGFSVSESIIGTWTKTIQQTCNSQNCNQMKIQLEKATPLLEM